MLLVRSHGHVNDHFFAFLDCLFGYLGGIMMAGDDCNSNRKIQIEKGLYCLTERISKIINNNCHLAGGYCFGPSTRGCFFGDQMFFIPQGSLIEDNNIAHMLVLIEHPVTESLVFWKNRQLACL